MNREETDTKDPVNQPIESGDKMTKMENVEDKLVKSSFSITYAFL